MKRLLPLVTLLLARSAVALAPHECLVLVNEANPDSLEVANWFTHLRGIPGRLVVQLQLDPEQHKLNIGTNGFRNLILAPANQATATRGLEPQVAAWVFSAGLPTTVRTSPEMSVTGMAFTRGEVPPEAILKNGSYLSPYFAGPAERAPPAAGPTAGFRARRGALGPRPPLPAMMLGVTKKYGNSVPTVIGMLKRGVEAEASNPKGPVQFLFQDDIRWSCREWQFVPVTQELAALGVEGKIVNQMKKKGPALAGLMTGAQRLDLETFPPFLPGTFAEHLTSFAGYYAEINQMRCAAWFDHGASGSAGTVTEPYAIWTKFPHARIFVHYARGCTLIESLYQALACPFQSLALGDPLCRPYGPHVEVNVEASIQGSNALFRASVAGLDEALDCELVLDGQRRGRSRGSPDWQVPLTELPAGSVEYGIAVRADNPVGVTAWKTGVLALPHPTARLVIEGGPEWKGTDSLALRVAAAGLKGPVELRKGEVSVGRREEGSTGPIPVTTAVLGRGPSRLVAEGRTPDGKVFRSAPAVVWME